MEAKTDISVPQEVTMGAHKVNDSLSVEDHIASGGYGDVFRGHLGIRRTVVAVKRLDAACKHTAVEVALHPRLHHPYIVPAYSAERDASDASKVYMPMELASGDLLDAILDAGGLREAGALPHLARVAVAVQHAHERGVFHRDIKPENVLLDAARTRSMLTDFGSAFVVRPKAAAGQACASCGAAGRCAAGGALRAFAPAGSVTYAAPEVFTRFGTTPMGDVPMWEGDEGYCPAAADVWSLGVLLYVAVTGRAPWEEPSQWDARFAALAAGTFPKPRSMPAAAFGLFLAATAVEPRDRCSLAEFMAHPWLAGAVAEARAGVAAAVDLEGAVLTHDDVAGQVLRELAGVGAGAADVAAANAAHAAEKRRRHAETGEAAGQSDSESDSGEDDGNDSDCESWHGVFGKLSLEGAVGEEEEEAAAHASASPAAAALHGNDGRVSPAESLESADSTTPQSDAHERGLHLHTPAALKLHPAASPVPIPGSASARAMPASPCGGAGSAGGSVDELVGSGDFLKCSPADSIVGPGGMSSRHSDAGSPASVGSTPRHKSGRASPKRTRAGTRTDFDVDATAAAPLPVSASPVAGLTNPFDGHVRLGLPAWI